MLHDFVRHRAFYGAQAVKRLRGCVAVIGLAVLSTAFAGCSSDHLAKATAQQPMPAPPPASTMQAIDNSAPPPPNLPASMPQAEKDQIIAQQRQDWENAKAARDRMFAAAASETKH